MQTLIICVLISILLVQFIQTQEEGENFCDEKAHYNGVSITCCAGKKYAAPANFNPFKVQDSMKECLDELKGAEKLIEKLWKLYNCVLGKQIKADVTLDSFTNFMLTRFESNDELKKAVKMNIDAIKKELPRERRKRRVRVRREDEDTGTTETPTGTNPTTSNAGTTEESNDPQTTVSNTKGTEDTTTEGTTAESNKEQQTTDSNTGSSDDTTGGSTTENNKEEEQATDPSAGSSDDTTPGGSTGATKDPLEKTTSTVETTEENIDPVQTTETMSEVTTKRVPYVHTMYEYFSIFEYFEKFSDKIPQDLLQLVRTWDVYYTAEFLACHQLAKTSDSIIKSYSASRCYSWLQSSVRRGDCCEATPIPFPLIEEPPLDIETVQNYKAEKLMILPGTYTWTNYSYSSNIMRCRRLATAVLLEQIDIAEFKRWMDEFVSKNATQPPDYKKIAGSLVPSFYPKTLRDQIVADILPEKNPEETKDEKQYYRSIASDSDIQKIANVNNTEFIWSAPHEWEKEKLDTNKARFLMWSCDVFKMISQRIKFFDISPFC